MIVQIRIDDRLIHGQVAIMWGKALDTKGILVANDHAAADKAQAATLKMACPQDQKLLIRGVEESVRVANDPRMEAMRVFCLCATVADALALVKGAPGKIGGVNIANVGRFDRTDEALKKQLCTNVKLNPNEVEACRELCEQGVPVFHQVGVTDAKSQVKDLLARL